MYYSLNENYWLRGWQGVTCAIVQRPYNNVSPVSTDLFRVLLLCDGETDFSASDLEKQEQELLHNLIRDEIVTESCEPKPLLKDQLYKCYDNRFVQSVFWSVTGRCNFRCRHCYMDAPTGKLGELSTEEALNLIDQMAECGVMRVDLTGGEPFVRKDFWTLIDRLLSYKIVINEVYSNGWLINDELLDKFEQRGIKPLISISFDGIGWHDWMRGVPGAEEAALRALRLCKKRGFPINIEMCLHKGNKDSLRETMRICDELQAQPKISSVSNTDLWIKNSEGNGMTTAEYVDAILEYIPYYYKDGITTPVMFSGICSLFGPNHNYSIIPEHYDGTEKCLDELLCGAVRLSAYITPEGRLLPCMPMTACKEQEYFAKVQDIGLKKGLSDSFYMKFVNNRVRDLLAANPKCAACEDKYRCGGGCRAVALETTGDLMGCDALQCEFTKAGYIPWVRKAIEDAMAEYLPEKDAEEQKA